MNAQKCQAHISSRFECSKQKVEKLIAFAPYLLAHLTHFSCVYVQVKSSLS